MIRFVAGDDGKVWVIKPNTSPRLMGEYEWGMQTPLCAQLARAMLEEILPQWVESDLVDDMVERFYRRFMHRVVTPERRPRWNKTDAELVPIVKEMARFALEEQANVQRMAREPPVGMMNAGGMGEAKWGSERSGYKGLEPTLTPNRSK